MPKNGYNDSIEELENIIAKLESGELDLQEAVELFEKGTKIYAKCSAMLDSSQSRIDVLFEEAGMKKERKFEIDETEYDES